MMKIKTEKMLKMMNNISNSDLVLNTKNKSKFDVKLVRK